ncbi:MAG: hypothetical protein J0H49_35310 [Acidobacteria bacterium]|nr:hypothetical protein [Acidobacteriota bacterium]
MRTVIALILVTLLCSPLPGKVAPPSPEMIREQIAHMKPGEKITVKLRSKKKIKCTLIAADNTEMKVMTLVDKVPSQITFAFEEIRDVSQQAPAWVYPVLITAGAIGALLIWVAAGGVPYN